MLTPLPHNELSFEDAANRFLLQYGEGTRRAYKTDLNCWRRFAELHGFDVKYATNTHIYLYLRHCEEILGLSKPSIARRLASLRGFYAMLCDMGQLDSNPANSVRSPGFSNESVALGMDMDTVLLLVGGAKQANKRLYALVSLLALNGVRISEALNADIEDLGQSRGVTTLQIVRKGSKTATIALSEPVCVAITDYVSNRDTGPIFVTTTGKRWDRVAAWRAVNKLVRDCGIEQSIHPHTFRHSFVTLCLDAGVPLHEVQDAVGHASPVTTQRYNRSRNALDNAPTFRLATALGMIQ